jgi:serine/threonine-protein kinase ULK2
MAPEILRCQQYGPEVDLWSIGTVLYEMLTGKPPFRAQNHVDLLIKIDKSEDKIRFPTDKEGNAVSEPLRDLCLGLLKRDPKDRMTFQAFFAHPALQEDSPETRLRRLSITAGSTPPRTPQEETSRPPSGEFFVSRGGTAMAQTPSNEAHPNVPQTRRVSPTYDITGPPIQPRRVSLTSTRPPLNVDIRTSPVLQHGSSPSSRYAPDLERHPSLRGNSSTLTTSGDRKISPGTRGYRPRTPDENPNIGASIEDYVLVEPRRAIEVNALADELAYSPNRRIVQPRSDAVIKRTTLTIVNAGTSPVSHNRATSRAGLVEQRSVSAPVYSGNQSPSPTSQGYIPSDRRFGTSPSSALAKAISMASLKLFGQNTPSPPFPVAYHTVQGGAMIKAGSAEEESSVKEIEEIALRSNVIYQFGEMKLSQVIGPSPSSTESMPRDRRPDSLRNNILTDEADAMICEEALALYIKSLTLLTKSMDLAAGYWRRRGGTGVASTRLNDAVQWGRERFNETLAKAEFVKSKIPIEGREPNVVATEKLIYDRALEMVTRPRG